MKTDLFLLFDKTKDMLQRWLFYIIGTLFSMALLSVVVSMCLDMSLRVAAALWGAKIVSSILGNGPEGLSSQAMRQGGIGLLLTVLIISVPPIMGTIFHGTWAIALRMQHLVVEAWPDRGRTPSRLGRTSHQQLRDLPAPEGTRVTTTALHLSSRASPARPTHLKMMQSGSGTFIFAGTIMKSALLLLVCLSLIRVVHAEGNCPPGYFPTTPSGAQGPQGCAPIPNYNQSTAPQTGPHWVSRWGAIVTSSTDGVLGAASGMPSQRKAEKEALEDCKRKGGQNCEIAVSYANGCGALVASNTGFATTYGATEKEAIQSGMKICGSDGDTGCHAYYTTCSPPLQVQ